MGSEKPSLDLALVLIGLAARLANFVRKEQRQVEKLWRTYDRTHKECSPAY